MCSNFSSFVCGKDIFIFSESIIPIRNFILFEGSAASFFKFRKNSSLYKEQAIILPFSNVIRRIFNFRSNAVGIFDSFLNIWGADPRPKQSKETIDCFPKRRKDTFCFHCLWDWKVCIFQTYFDQVIYVLQSIFEKMKALHLKNCCGMKSLRFFPNL